MRSFRILCAAVLLSASTSAMAQPRGPLVVAHRGGALLRPENTLSALRNAADLGADVLEFDMMMTADDRIAIYHDDRINPDFCTADTGSALKPAPVRSLTAAQVRQFDCGSGARPSYRGSAFVSAPGARIPTLNEIFRTFKDRDVRFFPETKIPKGSDVDPVKFATLLNDAVVKYGLEDRVILQSFDFRTVDALYRLNPRIRSCLLGLAKLTRDYLPVLRQHHSTCIVLDQKDVSATEVRVLQKAGITVFGNVADTPEEWRRYLVLGTDAIFSNQPKGAIAFLKAAKRRR